MSMGFWYFTHDGLKEKSTVPKIVAAVGWLFAFNCLKKSIDALFMTLAFTLIHDSWGSGQCECVMILHWQGSQPMRDWSISAALSSACIDQSLSACERQTGGKGLLLLKSGPITV